ncbi:MAG: bifunctional metallophosphatase/5'-nucleotidase, partial [Bacteroidales bacterium]|nr:bifunctional metallophosphatase/5'-nucleotidase [Bacteroidales bacterium]
MRRSVLTLLAGCLLCLSAAAQPKEVHIISANDIHAKIQNFPQLAAIVDSMRAVYPSLLVLSAGDNRTGEPLNDLYEIPAYPMVALMNQVGFDATTLGNHEFDSGQAGLAQLISLSNFPYICANVQPDPKWGMHLDPYKIFVIDDIKVGIVGAVQLGTAGHPDSHPDNCTEIEFTPVKETLEQYKWLRDQCDVVIFLSHLGYDDDVKISADIPWVDLIIGGHSHTQLAGGEMHNGLLITQNVNRLERVTHITLKLDGGKLVSKTAENIEVQGYPKQNKVVAELVRFFSDNPAFQRVLCQLERPVSSYEELGCLMTDAWRVETGSDVAFTNAGGIRFDSLPAGPFTVSDVLRLDPFGNETVQLTL